MSLNLANDWQVIDDVQPITYYPKVNDGVYAPSFPVSGCYWEYPEQTDYTRNPKLLMQSTRSVHIWNAQMSGNFLSGIQIVPVLDDKIVDSSGTVWITNKVEYFDLDANGVQRYRVTCYLGV